MLNEILRIILLHIQAQLSVLIYLGQSQESGETCGEIEGHGHGHGHGQGHGQGQ